MRRGLPPIDPDESQSRLVELQVQQRALTVRAHAARVGSRTRILTEGPSRRGAEQRMGRCPHNRVVNVSGPGPLEAGRFVEVDIVGATAHSLLGQPASATPELSLRVV